MHPVCCSNFNIFQHGFYCPAHSSRSSPTASIRAYAAWFHSVMPKTFASSTMSKATIHSRVPCRILLTLNRRPSMPYAHQNDHIISFPSCLWCERLHQLLNIYPPVPGSYNVQIRTSQLHSPFPRGKNKKTCRGGPAEVLT